MHPGRRQIRGKRPVNRANSAHRARSRRLAGVTLIEILVVAVIIGIGASGLSFSLGAMTKANLRGGAGKVAAAVKYSYNRAVMKGTTVRIAFDVPGGSFSIEEGSGRVTLARVDDERRTEGSGEDGEEVVAADPWAAAQSRIDQALKPNLGASPFGPLETSDGKTLERYTNVPLGRRVQIIRLIVPHHPAPLEQGRGAVHFFPGGMTEHAVVHLSDGGDTVYSVEVHPLTGRSRIRAEAYEPEDFLDDPEHTDTSEVDP
jgi:prepilin-type N-terminal cleavage/methylation domain-containing protein